MSVMGAEIAEQPVALRRTLEELVPRIGEIASLARGTRHVLLIGRGSSDNAAVYGSYLLQAYAGRLATLASPSIATEYRADVDLSGVLAVGLSQSGHTAEIVETVRWAAGCGARTLGITNGADSPLTEVAELSLVTQAGRETAIPATKTYTAQLAALAVLALGLGAELDTDRLWRVPDTVAETLARPHERLDLMVESLVGVHGAVVSGRGLAFAAALEAALKLKEACYLHAMGLSYADLLHGPIAVVDTGTPAILMAADSGPMVSATTTLARRVSSSGAPVYGIGGGSALSEVCDVCAPGPDLPEWLAPIGLIVPAQLLTEGLARRLGYDPDQPRGLGKVTQTS